MRTTIRTLGIAAAGFVTAIGVAGASDPYQVSPESKAYVGFSFGGEKAAPRDLHYGLRIGPDLRDSRTTPNDSRIAPDAPALMQFDFNRRGFSDARVNGLSVLKQEYRLRLGQAEGAPAEGAAAAAPAEEEGFFSGIWHSITNFFGGGDKPAEGAAPAAAPAEAASAGGWSAVDWGLLAVGVAGVGVAGASSIGKKETPDAGTPGGVGGGGGGGGGGGCNTQMLTTTCLTTMTYTPTRWSTPYDAKSNDPEYQNWLDGGTGHMGDLGG